MIEPIKPSEVADTRNKQIPEEVIKVFNDLIAKHWMGTYAIIPQKEAVDLIAEAMRISPDEVYKREVLDIEDIYRKVGWVVRYDSPAYHEDYPPTFRFSKKVD